MGSISAVLETLRIEHFRCIDTADLDLGPALNVFLGGNGAGKTSILEAIHVLGLGRSFRATDQRVLIQSGAGSARISGRVSTSAGPTTLGVEISPTGLETRAGGVNQPGASAMAELLPVQAMHAEIAGLVQGPPEARRRLLDWGVFHVEHRFLDRWRACRRAQQQRNAVLRTGGPDSLLEPWERALAEAAADVDAYRRAYLAAFEPVFARIGGRLLGAPVGLTYSRGWAADQDLAAVLAESREGDRAVGHTRAGPSRADLQFEIADTRSRWRASKGQQKLLAAAAIVSQLELVAAARGRPVALLVDEPAADLDSAHLAELMQVIQQSPAQVFLAAITADGLPLSPDRRMFHVEHGKPKALL